MKLLNLDFLKTLKQKTTLQEEEEKMWQEEGGTSDKGGQI